MPLLGKTVGVDDAERLADTPLAKARVANWRVGIFVICARVRPKHGNGLDIDAVG